MPSRPNRPSGNKENKHKRPAVRSGKSGKTGLAQADAMFKRSAAAGNGRMPTLFLKEEETAKCRVVKMEGYDPKPIKTHSIKKNGRWLTKICAGKKCRLCSVGLRASPAVVWPAIDTRKRKWTDKQGKTHKVENESVLLLVRKRSFAKFKKLALSGKLYKRLIKITRYGESIDTMYDPEAGRKLTPEELKMKFELDLDKVLAPPSSSEMKVLAAAARLDDDDDSDDDADIDEDDLDDEDDNDDDFDDDFDDDDDDDDGSDDDDDDGDTDDDDDLGDDDDDDDDLDDDDDDDLDDDSDDDDDDSDDDDD